MAHSYATTASIEILMIGTEFDTATTALCDKLLTRAENEIDKYLSKRYDTAALHAEPPSLLESLAEQICEAYMYLSMARGNKDMRANALSMLKVPTDNLQMIADYKADLIDNTGDKIPDGSNTPYRILSNTDEYSSTFNEDDELEQRVDQLKLEDIDSERSRNG
jgi:phage gp36-like protein